VQEGEVLLTLDPLGRRLEPETVDEVDHGADDGRVSAVDGDSRDEGAVDLDARDGQCGRRSARRRLAVRSLVWRGIAVGGGK